MNTLKLLGALVLCSSYATIAQAQVAPDAPAKASDQDENLPVITVTGTRVARDGSQAPTPVTAVSTESLVQSAPSNLPDALNKLPQFSGSVSQTAGGTFNAGSLPLGNYMNLRSLGSARMRSEERRVGKECRL